MNIFCDWKIKDGFFIDLIGCEDWNEWEWSLSKI